LAFSRLVSRGNVIAVPSSSFEGAYSTSIVTVSAGGGKQRVLTHTDLWLGLVAWLPDSKGLIVMAQNQGQVSQSQVWQVSYPSGSVNRVTHDLNAYHNPSLTADGKALCVIESQTDSNIWVAPKAKGDQTRQITSVAQGTEGLSTVDWPSGNQIFYSSEDAARPPPGA